MIINFIQVGPFFIGNEYQTDLSYIDNFDKLTNHLRNNFLYHLNVFNNKIFWFFVSALITQKVIKWTNS